MRTKKSASVKIQSKDRKIVRRSTTKLPLVLGMDADRNLKLTPREIAAAFADPSWSACFPPVLNVEQAAALLQVPPQTIYDWRCRGLLTGCCRKVGKHLRFFRDRLVAHAFNDGLNSNAE